VLNFFIDLFDLLEPNYNNNDRKLIETARKGTYIHFKAHSLVAIVFITLGISILYVNSGLLEIQKNLSFLVAAQLFIGTLVVHFLDLILDSYGICSTYSLYIMVNGFKLFFWQAFSPVTFDTGRGPEFEGSVLCMLHLLFSWTDKSRAVEEALFRKGQPNVTTFVATIFAYITIIYLQGIII
jgi:protein transport protein SEC61 subunit alpha